MSLRSVLVVPFVLQISLAVGLTGWLSFRNGKLAVNDLTSQLMHEVSERISQQTDNYLEIPQKINRLNVDAVQANILKPTDFQETGRYFWRQSQVFNIDHIAFRAATGEYISAGHITPQDLVIDEVSKTHTKGDLYSYATDNQGNRAYVIKTIQKWDHRIATEYANMVQANKPTWSQIHECDDGSGTLSISAGYPIHSSTGKLLGVFSADLRLEILSNFLSNLKIGQNGEAFILERNGFLVASSSDQQLTLKQGETTKRLLATQSSNPLIQNTARYLLNQAGDFKALQPITQLSIDINGEQEFIRVTRYTNQYGLDWLIVIVVPETDFMAQIQLNTYSTALLCVCALLAAVAIGLITSRYLTRPILKIIDAAEALSEGQWNRRLPESNLREVGLLTQAFNSMAEQLQDSFGKLHHSAYHDVLTNLINRAAFINYLEEAVLKYQEDAQSLFSILFLDLDSFKLVNDRLGHLVGDELLIAVSRRIQSCLPDNAIAARLGGDEFIILLREIDHSEQATSLAEEISKSLSQPFNLKGYEIFTSASIGIVLSTAEQTHSEDFLRDADIAMYHAKFQGKSRYQVFDTLIHTQSKERLQLETDLRFAIEKGRFELYYQPIILSETQTVAGFEALVRWHHPTKGIIPPSQFIPIAEETGLIVQLGQWVLFESCRQLSLWQLRYPACSLFISVNISVRQLLQPNFLEQIMQTLQDTKLEPHSLKLEVAENIIINNMEAAGARLESLQKQGIQSSIDDFGKSYLSLSQLHRLPISVVKIDRSSVYQMMHDEGHFEITKTVILLAQSLNIDVVAKGVETQEQFEQLKQLGCRKHQGELFAPALPAVDIEKLICSKFIQLFQNKI